ncbi:MAG: glycosyltransferase family 4 protein [bacterium]
MIEVEFTPDAFLAQEYGGVSRCFTELARALHVARATSGVAPVLHAAIHGNAHLRALSRDHRVGLVRGCWLPIKGDMRTVAIHVPRWIFARRVRRKTPTIVQDTGYAFTARGACDAPVLITVHDMIREADPRSISSRSKGDNEKRAAIARATRIVVPSASTRDALISIEKVDPARIEVIHHGARLPEPSPSHPFDGEPYFLHVGPRKRYKDFLTAMRAFARLKRDGFRGRLVTVSRRALSGEERMYATHLGLAKKDVLVCAADDHRLATLYAHALAFVFPSQAEGFGIPILEAMSLGCPVACMRAPGSEEAAGGAALLTEPGDEAGLAANLARITTGRALRDDLVERGRARARELSWEAAAARYAELVRSLT